MVNKAKKYAARRHHFNGQTYDGFPYSRHLEIVESIALKYIFYIDHLERDNVLAACWCHDLIEDTFLTTTELAEITNKQVASIVFAVTNEEATSRVERNNKTFAKIGSSRIGTFVKLCDRIANTTNSRKHAPEIYSKYRADYPLLKAYLKNGDGSFRSMWIELDNLYN